MRVREVQPTVLYSQRSPVTWEIMYASAHLDVKLEISGEIRTVNISA